jgi:hypothetical protein
MLVEAGELVIHQQDGESGTSSPVESCASPSEAMVVDATATPRELGSDARSRPVDEQKLAPSPAPSPGKVCITIAKTPEKAMDSPEQWRTPPTRLDYEAGITPEAVTAPTALTAHTPTSPNVFLTMLRLEAEAQDQDALAAAAASPEDLGFGTPESGKPRPSMEGV